MIKSNTYSTKSKTNYNIGFYGVLYNGPELYERNIYLWKYQNEKINIKLKKTKRILNNNMKW